MWINFEDDHDCWLNLDCVQEISFEEVKEDEEAPGGRIYDMFILLKNSTEYKDYVIIDSERKGIIKILKKA